MKNENLASDDSDGRKSFPKRHPLAAVIAQDGAGSLDPVHQPDQALHCCHLLREGMDSKRPKI